MRPSENPEEELYPSDETAIEKGSVSEVSDLTSEAVSQGQAVQALSYLPKMKQEQMADALIRGADANTTLKDEQSQLVREKKRGQQIQNRQDEAIAPSKISSEKAKNYFPILVGVVFIVAGLFLFAREFFVLVKHPDDRFRWLGVILTVIGVLVLLARNLAEALASLIRLIRPGG